MFRVFSLIFLFTTSLAAPAGSASFDCAKASTERERLICANPGLSAADSRIGDSFAAALKALSEPGGKALLQGQRGWLRYLTAACPVTASGSQDAAERCLNRAYADRMADLSDAAVRKGAWLLTRIDQFSVTHGPADDPGIGLHHASFPRIDRPATATTAQWNGMIEQSGMRLSEPKDAKCDTTLDYAVGLVTPRVTSVTWTDWHDCHNQTRGGSVTVENLMLLPAPHPMRRADLFRSDRPWKARLTTLALSAIRTAAPPNETLALDDAAVQAMTTAVDRAAAEPKRWFLRQDGLALVFESYELGPGYCCNPTVLLAWHDLRDVLVAKPPVP